MLLCNKALLLVAAEIGMNNHSYMCATVHVTLHAEYRGLRMNNSHAAQNHAAFDRNDVCKLVRKLLDW